MKKSILESTAEACRMSHRFPNEKYYVMDKKGKHAICVSDATHKETVLKGYFTVCTIVNGDIV